MPLSAPVFEELPAGFGDLPRTDKSLLRDYEKLLGHVLGEAMRFPTFDPTQLGSIVRKFKRKGRIAREIDLFYQALRSREIAEFQQLFLRLIQVFTGDGPPNIKLEEFPTTELSEGQRQILRIRDLNGFFRTWISCDGGSHLESRYSSGRPTALGSVAFCASQLSTSPQDIWNVDQTSSAPEKVISSKKVGATWRAKVSAAAS